MAHHEGSTDPYMFRNAYHAARSDLFFNKNRLANPRLRSKQDRIFFERPAWVAGYTLGIETAGLPMMIPNQLTAAYMEWAEKEATHAT
jgi:hypothetical protein